MTVAPEPPADERAGYASPPVSDAGSPAGPRTRGRETGPAGKVTEGVNASPDNIGERDRWEDPRDTRDGETDMEPGASGREAWKAAISAHHAAQARNRPRAKAKPYRPGMTRRNPGDGT